MRWTQGEATVQRLIRERRLQQVTGAEANGEVWTARAIRTVSSGMLPSAWGYIDMDLLLPDALFANCFLLLYHSCISRIRQQSLSRVGFLRGREGVPVGAGVVGMWG